MTPWLRAARVVRTPRAPRALCVVGLLLALATGGAHPSYAAAGSASYAVTHAASNTASYAHEPSADASRAGSRPGEGRERPGREEPTGQPEAGVAEPDRDPAFPDDPAASAVSEPSPDAAIPVRQSVVRPGTDPEPVLRIVPLGSGLILIGLGLGLAFLALRVRRG
ncbi:hypothetical protein OHT59_23105 [Streptomyces sp. NBC_00243]|uniref:hypothetical protein n=1 Tax=Streptomyces sp. NBC_00243 TaxID=2975688 RepID=UPI002DDA9E52|nr:hypothetical protein [Streptomyces sp. NBC_00243]WRZ21190.1 hypothetical protein OHT59_23105 [Streptomyces sp. NBC_00243]